MKNKLTVRQVCFIYLAFILSGKLITMTAITAVKSKESCYLSALINLIFDGISLFFMLKLCDKYKDKTFYEIVSETLGEKTVKFVFFIYALYFLLKSYIPVLEHKNYVELTLYETSPSILLFIPFFFVSLFISYKGLNAFGRCSEILAYFTFSAIIILCALSFSNADFTNVLPIIGVPIKDVLQGSKNGALWFFDSSYFLFMLGNFKRENKQKSKIIFTYVACGLILLFYMIMIVSEFGSITERQFFAPVRMGKFSIAKANIGRFDFVASMFISISGIFTISMPLAFSSYALSKVFNFKKEIIPAIIINVISLIITVITDDFYFIGLKIVQTYFVYFFAFVSYVFPALFLLKKEKNK